MRGHGFELAGNAVLLRRMVLDGRIPGADGVAPIVSVLFGGTLMAWIWTRALRAMQPKR
ncbi:hypothetical protein [Sphingomonas montana]|uniref:hypothetical protein n=1 Tax=Sphingomonas montana TaxID=1843236 RepID=UPI0013E9F5BC|nr:hypothetical protein [Sphingomonas montana]